MDMSSSTSTDFGDSWRSWSPQRNAYNNQGPSWVGLLILGIMLIIFGMISIAIVGDSGSSIDYSYDPFAEQEREFDNTTNAIGGIMIFGGFVMILVSFLVRSHEDSLAMQISQETPEQPGPQIERRVVEEVIKVRCRYCSTLNDVDSKHCISCGAVL